MLPVDGLQAVTAWHIPEIEHSVIQENHAQALDAATSLPGPQLRDAPNVAISECVNDFSPYAPEERPLCSGQMRLQRSFQ